MSIDLNRDALVVGICRYDSLTMSEELKTLAKQSEQLAQLLETKGDFKVRRLPCTAEMCLHLKERVTSFKLKKAIEELFYPPEQAPTQTALLFFAGHGLMESTRVGNEGFLATSEADNKSVYGVSYQWLAKTLCNSPIKQQIVFIEACHSGAFLEAIKEEKKKSCFKDKDICLITSSRAHEESLANGLLTQDLLDILKNQNMTTDLLIKELNKKEKEPNRGSQRFQMKTQGKSIALTETLNFPVVQTSESKLFFFSGLFLTLVLISGLFLIYQQNQTVVEQQKKDRLQLEEVTRKLDETERQKKAEKEKLDEAKRKEDELARLKIEEEKRKLAEIEQQKKAEEEKKQAELAEAKRKEELARLKLEEEKRKLPVEELVRLRIALTEIEQQKKAERRLAEIEQQETVEREPNRKSKELKKTFTNSIGIEFVLIPVGSFQMGSDDNKKHVHQVDIKEMFYLGKYEVTQKQYQTIMGTNPSYFKGENRPVEKVSWDDAQEFIKKLNEKEGGTKKYRLPTEAEWEYAARSGSSNKWSFGDDENELKNYAWYWDNSDKETHDVGQKKPNEFGLYDIHGNVWEWTCSDAYIDYSDNLHKLCSNKYFNKILKGGSWRYSANDCQLSSRDYGSPDSSVSYSGFRIVSSP